MLNHTPKPWRYDARLGVIFGENVNIAEVGGWIDKGQHADANGILMAAAPEMYEKLRALVCYASLGDVPPALMYEIGTLIARIEKESS